MGSSPLVKAGITGTALQVAMVALGKFIPAIAAMPNFFAIAGTALAAVTGAMATRATPGATAGGAASSGAIVGAATSVIGGLAAVASGQWPGFEVVQLLFPAISGAVGGGIGGIVGRMTAKPQPA